jgi:hypothetical protein
MKYPSGVLPCLAKVYPTRAIGTPRTRAVRADLNENTEAFMLAIEPFYAARFLYDPRLPGLRSAASTVQTEA